MIDFRYHIVSIIAVFLALTVGLVLGSSFLDERVVANLGNQATGLRNENQKLQDQILELQRKVDYREEFAKSITPGLIRGRLAGQTVTIVTLPGVQDDMVDGLQKAAEDASATVAGRVAVQDSFVDEDKGTVLGELVSRLKPAGLAVPEDASPQQAASAVLASTIATPQGSSAAGEQQQQIEPSSATVLSGLAEGGFVSVSPDDGLGARADLLVVAAPPKPEDADDAPEDATGRYLELVNALDAHSQGVVVAGSEESAEEGGLTHALRSDGDTAGHVSSVDVADTAPGRIAVIFALVDESIDKSGHYGAGISGSSDGPLPEPPEGESK